MKNAPDQRLPQAVFGQEAQGQNQSARSLHAEASENYQLLKPHHALYLVQAERLRHQKPLPQADFPAKQEDYKTGGGHEAQPPDFNQTQQDALPEAAPLGPCIKKHQTGDAGGGGGGKQRRAKAAALTAPGGDGQRQQKRPQQDDSRKAQGDDLCGA